VYLMVGCQCGSGGVAVVGAPLERGLSGGCFGVKNFQIGCVLSEIWIKQ
jgi:hypothetical protein